MSLCSVRQFGCLIWNNVKERLKNLFSFKFRYAIITCSFYDAILIFPSARDITVLSGCLDIHVFLKFSRICVAPKEKITSNRISKGAPEENFGIVPKHIWAKKCFQHFLCTIHLVAVLVLYQYCTLVSTENLGIIFKREIKNHRAT